MWTTVALAIISLSLYRWTGWGVFSIIGTLCCVGLVIFLFYVMLFHVTKNTWKDGEKIMAVIYGVIVSSMLVFIVYLMWYQISDYFCWIFGC